MNMAKWSDVIARVFLAQIFIIAGVGKITDYAGTQEYMLTGRIPGLA